MHPGKTEDFSLQECDNSVHELVYNPSQLASSIAGLWVRYTLLGDIDNVQSITRAVALILWYNNFSHILLFRPKTTKDNYIRSACC